MPRRRQRYSMLWRDVHWTVTLFARGDRELYHSKLRPGLAGCSRAVANIGDCSDATISRRTSAARSGVPERFGRNAPDGNRLGAGLAEAIACPDLTLSAGVGQSLGARHQRSRRRRNRGARRNRVLLHPSARRFCCIQCLARSCICIFGWRTGTRKLTHSPHILSRPRDVAVVRRNSVACERRDRLCGWC